MERNIDRLEKKEVHILFLILISIGLIFLPMNATI